MKILITGGAGFIGSHLTRSLLQQDHQLFILTRHGTDTWRIDDILQKVTILPYESLDDLGKIFQHNFDGVIHLATLYKKADDKGAVRKMIKVNITFPSLLLQHASSTKCQFFINTGTCFEYKLSEDSLTEKSTTEGYNLYAATKLAFEQILQYTSSHTSLRTTTLRLFYPYGEKDNKKLITLLMNAFIHNKPISVSRGEQRLDYTYILDIVSAYEKAVSFITSDRYQGHNSVNIGIDKTVSIKEIGKLLEGISGKKNIVTFGDSYPEGEIMHMNCDYSKAQSLLGWQPEYSIEKGLRSIYDYYKLHPTHL